MYGPTHLNELENLICFKPSVSKSMDIHRVLRILGIVYLLELRRAAVDLRNKVSVKRRLCEALMHAQT